MNPTIPRLAVSLLLVSYLTACNLPQGGVTGPETGIVATKVALTLEALTQSAQQTPFASPGSPTSVQPANTQISTLTGTMVPTYTQIPTRLSTETIGPTNTPIPGLGTIAGGVYGYPYGSIPSLAIVAFEQEAPYRYWYLLNTPGSTYYSMDEYITTGNYQVVAYDSSGHAGGCTNNVLVKSNQTVNCDITNWGGGYPAKPSDVPNP